MGGVLALWYTLAIYLDGADCEFEYVWMDTCLCCGVWVGMGELARARAVFVCVCVNVCVCLVLCLSDFCVRYLCV